jgi:hypothetical protein
LSFGRVLSKIIFTLLLYFGSGRIGTWCDNIKKLPDVCQVSYRYLVKLEGDERVCCAAALFEKAACIWRV